MFLFVGLFIRHRKGCFFTPTQSFLGIVINHVWIPQLHILETFKKYLPENLDERQKSSVGKSRSISDQVLVSIIIELRDLPLQSSFLEPILLSVSVHV